MQTHSNDCQVLYIGNHHETYRGINDALGTMGLTVMWVRDLDSAEMLAKTTNTEMIVCDKALRRKKDKLFVPSTIKPGATCIELELPEPDPTGRLFEKNLNRTAKLPKVVKNLKSVNSSYMQSKSTH